MKEKKQKKGKGNDLFFQFVKKVTRKLKKGILVLRSHLCHVGVGRGDCEISWPWKALFI